MTFSQPPEKECNAPVVNGHLACDLTTHPDYYHCGKCGSVPPKHITLMQKGACVVCGGRTCLKLHGGTRWSMEDPRCSDCYAFDCYPVGHPKNDTLILKEKELTTELNMLRARISAAQ
jgi:hypothetical protein